VKNLCVLGAVFAFACGGNHSGGGQGSGGSSAFTLAIAVSGQGTVAAAAQQISCASSCTQSLPSGTVVHLEAVAGAGMQFSGWNGACSGTAGCDLTMTQDTQVGATFVPAAPPPPATALLSVVLVGSGSGRVTSSPAGIDCPGSCAVSLPVGTAVTVSAAADATSQLAGFGAGCSGMSCTLTLAADTTVYVNFSSTVTPPGMHTLTVSVSGDGSVSSMPIGVSCPGKCSATFADGTTVALTETAGASASFAGWSGACTGSAACSVTLGADASVAATFAAASNACAGLTPALPAARDLLAAAPGGAALACIGSTADAAGNVFIRGEYDAGGTATVGVFGASGLVESVTLDQTLSFGPIPLASGFGVFIDQQMSTQHYAGYAPDGTLLNSNAELTPASVAFGDDASDGGNVLLNCDGSTDAQYTVTRYDGAAKQVAQSSFIRSGTFGCLAPLAVMTDALGNTLVIVSDKSNDLEGAWLDASGTQINGWFDIGNFAPSMPPGFAAVLARPLIGGGAAVRVNGSWTVQMASGSPMTQPAPSFFEIGKDAVIAMGGKAYAMIPDPNSAGTIDVVEPGGTTCEALANATAADFFTLGKDGTLVDAHGANDCTATYYPQALK